MRILHVGWGYPPRYLFGGPVYYVHRLALRQRELGHEVSVACASDHAAPEMAPWAVGTQEWEGIPYLHLVNRPAHMLRPDDPAAETLDTGCEDAFLAVLERERPDVVHVHNLVGLCLTLPRLARQRGVPVLMSLHNYWPLCPRVDLFQAEREACPGAAHADCGACLGTSAPHRAYMARHAAAIAALESCDRLLAVSTRVAEIYVEQGVDPALVRVQRIGSDAAVRLWEGGGRERRSEPPPAEPSFAFFGSRVPNKGPHVILRALALMRNAGGYRFRFFGASGGPAFDAELERLTRELGPRAANVSTRGHYTQDELPGLLAAADVAVLTPQWEDNGPQTVFESLGAGLPVVGTAMGGVPDVVEDGRNGLLVPAADPGALAAALDLIVDDPSLVAELRRGIEPPLSMEAHAEDLEATYAEVLADRRPAPRLAVLLRGADRRDGLLACLQAVAAACAPDVEVVVVDEGSRDGTRELLASICGDVRVITRARRGTPTQAVREAAAAARAPRVVVLDPDRPPVSGWLEAALAGPVAPTAVAPGAVAADRALAAGIAGAGAVAELLAGRRAA
jgi:glycosyltransferase involved in cell wall biosynthesis